MSKNEDNRNKLVTVLLIAAAVIMVFNTVKISTLAGGAASGGGAGSEGADGIIPTGVPKIYGSELGISFDAVNAANPQLADQTIEVMGNLDRNIQLTGADLERYKKILYTMEGGISCEYCCGAKSIIFENGQAACGCAHSFAMRGLAKYLITKHGSEYTDAEIFSELAKWKVLYFPTQMTQKAQALKDKGIEFSYINVGSNKYRGIEKGAAAGGMVGGC